MLLKEKGRGECFLEIRMTFVRLNYIKYTQKIFRERYILNAKA